jgi:hypothetical protein
MPGSFFVPPNPLKGKLHKKVRDAVLFILAAFFIYKF